MCGIYLSISSSGYVPPNPGTRQFLHNRGPDSSKEHKVAIGPPAHFIEASLHQPLYITFISSVLSLRGSNIVSQPLIDEASRSVLCWNGEAWKLDDAEVTGNDSQKVFELFINASTGEAGASELTTHKRILKAISSISGPFAFVFYDAPNARLYYGRDCLGRRSLLRKTDSTGKLILSSICDIDSGDQWSEVEADGVYFVELFPQTNVCSQHILIEKQEYFNITHVPYGHNIEDEDSTTHLRIPFPPFSKALPNSPPPTLSLSSPSVAQLHQALLKSLELRIRDVRLSFEVVERTSQNDSKIAILFSGGLDCTVLARLAHDILPIEECVDLLNVAFQNPRVHRSLGNADEVHPSPYELCPDRITGRTSYNELQKVCPGRTWRFVEVNIPYSETVAHRDTVVSLMHPHNTEMDLSISYALYFASRGVGLVRSPFNGEARNYTTPAHVLISGLGADELFGGYQRHATAFSRRGYPGLTDELELDINRLGKRNLGRDDRVISNWSKEARFPYLDEELLSWALDRPVWEKCGFGEYSSSIDLGHSVAEIEPGKKILRLLAQKLAMTGVAVEKKRAIQFGTRTAKMETGKTKGTQILT
ncbi:hypothetical protein AOQ84DRAFT_390514 [Glonium stellatum]|uniref:Glutamine amidotransferase type-2 domain-containing protein n=1 Tax=Glonium stellatum TaxID=574774 RepID=A0A8E2JR31_9PEZI|nr:hypothetical protein AOQ84DRAFT_390514 [Glonium stellatum]